jgi:hypothetical protein
MEGRRNTTNTGALSSFAQAAKAWAKEERGRMEI